MTERGFASASILAPAGSRVVDSGAAGVGALAWIAVEWADDFNMSANEIDTTQVVEIAGMLQVNDDRVQYVGWVPGDLEDDPDVIYLADALPASVAEGDMCSPVSGDQVVQNHTLIVALGDGEPVEVAVPFTQRDRWPTGAYDPVVEVILSDDLSEVVDAPGRLPTIAGQMLGDGTVGGGKLQPSASIDFVNGRFEDGERDDFPGWRKSWPFGEDTVSRLVAKTEGDQIAGSRSCGIELDAGASYRMLGCSMSYPVVPGDTIEVSAIWRASRSVSGAGSDPIVSLIVHTGDGSVVPDAIFEPAVTWQDVAAPTSLGTANVRVRGRVTVPAGHKEMRVSVKAWAPSDGNAWTLTVDEMHWSRADIDMTPHAWLKLDPSGQTIPGDGSFHDITIWQTVEAEGITTSSTGVTATLAGRYQVAARVSFAVSGAGERLLQVKVNGTVVASASVTAVGSGFLTTVQAVQSIRLDVGDMVTFAVRQTTGADLGLSVSTTNTAVTIDRLSA